MSRWFVEPSASDAVDPAEHMRGQELVMVCEIPVERSA
jgi:hypothetical protein